MGMDVYGIAPASEAGKYFRNTVWSWRPLATFLCERYPEETAGCSYWQSNDADGLDADTSRKLAERLRADLLRLCGPVCKGICRAVRCISR